MIQYIYEKYGRERAGLAAPSSPIARARAIREVGKAFGLSEDTVVALVRHGLGLVVRRDRRCETKPPRRFRSARAAAQCRRSRSPTSSIGFPRHLSQHAGGFVITRTRLDEVVPIANAAMEDRTVDRMGQGRSRRAENS